MECTFYINFVFIILVHLCYWFFWLEALFIKLIPYGLSLSLIISSIFDWRFSKRWACFLVAFRILLIIWIWILIRIINMLMLFEAIWIRVHLLIGPKYFLLVKLHYYYQSNRYYKNNNLKNNQKCLNIIIFFWQFLISSKKFKNSFPDKRISFEY